MYVESVGNGWRAGPTWNASFIFSFVAGIGTQPAAYNGRKDGGEEAGGAQS